MAAFAASDYDDRPCIGGVRDVECGRRFQPAQKRTGDRRHREDEEQQHAAPGHRAAGAGKSPVERESEEGDKDQSCRREQQRLENRLYPDRIKERHFHRCSDRVAKRRCGGVPGNARVSEAFSAFARDGWTAPRR